MIIDTANRWFVIVNPVAGKGLGLTDWPVISKLLRDNSIAFDFAFTEHRFHAIELSVEAVNNGYRRLIVVGGDGTLNEVVNGLFIQKAVPQNEVLLSVIAVGTGNDWVRMFGIPRTYTDSIKSIVAGHSFLQDVGKVSYYKASYHQSRYMANVAGVGFDASVNRRFNRRKEEGKRGKFLYILSTLKALFGYRSTHVKISVDGKVVVDQAVFSATIGIGKYNGGGMLQTPDAVPDDGLFDLTIIRKISKFGVIRNFGSLYNGRIYRIKQISLDRGRKIHIESTPEIATEVDGEALGYSPFDFEIIPKAIRVVVSEKFLLSED
ncbi:MAG: diacylglycerol kinase family lipid kinase [Rikenellaceae bacterium]|nr:diacylglycerol kinase family lipid kinase [Rikenellaceae bacterium]